MEKSYFINLHMKVPHGMMQLGKFSVGSDKAWAFQSFNQLQGERKLAEDDVLRLELLEKHEDAELSLEQISCRLDELEHNCRIITVDAFKYFNLEA